MSKELEALNIIEDTRDDLKILRDFDDAVALLRKALTPPTAEEVCKALSECLRLDKFNSKCIFEDNNFYERCDDGVLETIVECDNGLIDIYFNLPADLVELVAKYYKGAKNNEL